MSVEILEFALLVMACVIVSTVVSRLVRRVAPPLVQILAGFLVALLVPAVTEFQVSSELFLMLFIAPLLFDEARRTNRYQLWANKGSIASLAIGLVLATVLCAGFALNALVPSIPLAAAFACAAALAPTDAAAVGALGASIDLQPRQKTLLSGESLINDASGVVSFQFAIAAAVTGEFSLLEAGERFAQLFFGGIALGLALGAVGLMAMRVIRHFGLEDTTLHVIYEVFTPFVVYLLAEWLDVSGILAVVAAGLVMADRASRLLSIDAARRQRVSDDFWKVIVFLINGVIFVMLGMQLPLALAPEVREGIGLTSLVLAVAALTFIIMACRFVWVSAMEFIHRDGGSGKRGLCDRRRSLRNALIMTLAGPKGAVTLSLIFTIPLTIGDASFPSRDLIIFLTACVILITLLLANCALPLISPQRRSIDDEVDRAAIAVLEGTIDELKQMLADEDYIEYFPALSMTEARYETRLVRRREASTSCGKWISELSRQALEVQQARADELQGSPDNKLSVAESVPYYEDLREIRSTIGYVGAAVNVGSRFRSIGGRARILLRRLRPFAISGYEQARIYYDTCLFAIELERCALDYLRGIDDGDECRKHAAEILASSHEAAIESLEGRINYGQDTEFAIDELGPHERLPEGMQPGFAAQMEKARRYADEADSNALVIELDIIRRMEAAGDISQNAARQLRREVHALQGAIEGE